jgi:hypothetical protein
MRDRHSGAARLWRGGVARPLWGRSGVVGPQRRCGAAAASWGGSASWGGGASGKTCVAVQQQLQPPVRFR